MARFSILTHDYPFLHWDFLLEAGQACRTWRLLNPPDFPAEISAEALADHRLIYLDYEGPVSGDRGTVRQWDRGVFEWQVDEENAVEVDITGGRLQGRIILHRISGNCWVWSNAKNKVSHP